MTKLLFTKMYPDVRAPRLGTEQSVGADIHAYCRTESGRPSKILVPPKTTRPIPTGLIVACTENVFASDTMGREQRLAYTPFVCSRSGMAKERSVFVTNSPGIIDPDYRGEIFVLLYNGGHEAHYVQHEDRIAQIVLVPTPIPEVIESLFDLGKEETTRGSAGFGSTGR